MEEYNSLLNGVVKQYKPGLSLPVKDKIGETIGIDESIKEYSFLHAPVHEVEDILLDMVSCICTMKRWKRVSEGNAEPLRV